MNRMKARLILVILFTAFFISCENEGINIQSNTPVFNLDKFEENLNEYVNANGNSPVGWAYTISINGQLERSKAEGVARTEIDGELAFILNKEINIASITKFYTAIAVMQLLEANNLNINDKIDSWLPSSWEQGPAIDNLSFADLLGSSEGLK